MCDKMEWGPVPLHPRKAVAPFRLRWIRRKCLRERNCEKAQRGHQVPVSIPLSHGRGEEKRLNRTAGGNSSESVERPPFSDSVN